MIPVARSKKFVGHLKEYVDQPLDFLMNKWKEEGDIFRFRLAHRYLIVISHPDYVKHIMQENHTNYKKSLAYRKLKLLLGNGLFTSEGEYWLKQRRLAQPAFHKERITNYFETMTAFAYQLIAKWQEECKEGNSVYLHKEMTVLTLKIISKTLLGIELSEEGRVVEENLPFALKFMIRRVTSTVNFPMSFPLKKHIHFKRAVQSLYSSIDGIILNKRKLEDPGIDLLAILMGVEDEETGEKMSDQQLKDEILTFFLAGHETSAVALTWTIYLLMQNPSELAKVKAEVDAVLKDQPFNIAHLKQLTYTTMVIKETMRIVSPVWVLGREALGEDVLGNHKINKGQSVIFSPYLVHRHPDFWEQPDTFNPQRFTPEKEAKMHKFAYFPFGGGPRLCIGASFAMMEMQVILSLLIKSFDFTPKSVKHPGFNYSLTLRPSSEIELNLN
jgi:cytochrome P450